MRQPHPRYGLYEYSAIVQALTDRGFRVISEVRQSDVHPRQYASRVADEVGELLKAGIAPQDISIVGHSKGGNMALIVASLLQQEDANYVILAGCGKGGLD
jgi:acetyl esterase/lipase